VLTVVQASYVYCKEKVPQPARTLTVMEAASLDVNPEATFLQPYRVPCVFAMIAAWGACFLFPLGALDAV